MLDLEYTLEKLAEFRQAELDANSGIEEARMKYGGKFTKLARKALAIGLFKLLGHLL